MRETSTSLCSGRLDCNLREPDGLALVGNALYVTTEGDWESGGVVKIEGKTL